jgi:alkaline phosphatase
MVTWSTTNHTSVNVPLYAFGKNAELFHGEMDNTDFFPIIAPRKE